jgi:tRNA(Ile2) C34 agmatinyltransferase TiaS
MNVHKLKLILNKRLTELEKEKNTILQILEDINDRNLPKCPYCNVSNLRFNKDKSCFCRSCGQWSKKIEDRIVQR